ncbi:hypothetical protein ACTXMW_03335 [Brachybacterium paraconglomeratum]|uniref:hypothetical protein n=1 Tax=Brachybacterium paraconglomeratum TaxID=173362 RepID=UPI003FD3D9B6
MSFLHFYSQAKNAHSIIVNAASTRQHASPGEIIALLDDLESHGVTVTHADEFRALVNFEPAPSTVPDPFSTDPSAAHGTVTERSLRSGENGRRMSIAWADYIRDAGRKLLDSMAAEADTYIETLRPSFDAAATTTAAALALDLNENTTYETLVEDGTPEEIDAWRAYLEARATLDRIATTRIAMSAWLDLPPQGNANYSTEVPDYTPAFVTADTPMSRNVSQISANALTHRWLNLQNSAGTALNLNTIAELDAVGYARGHAVA